MPSSGVYAQGQNDIQSGTFNLVASSLKTMLVTGYTPNFNTDKHYSDVSGVEISGTGYTAGGLALAGSTVTTTAANSWATTWAATTVYTLNQIVRPTSGNGFIYRCVQAGTSGGSQPSFGTVVGETTSDSGVVWECAGVFVLSWTATNPSWAGATLSATGAIIYWASGTGSTATLIVYLDFGGTVVSTAGTFLVTLPTNPGIYAETG